ncbi:hypothetical protein ACFWZT_25445 [Streptomyces alboflavus]|uniref:hypothetical protein n=1 Tax=Streptomyces alboflavus TaxID=67267 RepID=UPI0036A3FA44
MNVTSELDDQVTKLYSAYTEHLSRCPRSHVRADCVEGMRLRKAWTAAQWASLKARRTGGRPHRTSGSS